MMLTRRRRWIVIAGILLVLFVSGIVWWISSPTEPTHAGKSLSVWLEEIVKLDYAKRADSNSAPVAAVRAIGTNAIPWLLEEFYSGNETWRWKLNRLLNKQHVIKGRLMTKDDRLLRGTLGFMALGELGEPAIPMLLNIVEEYPGYAPGALAGIGRPALPALQQCLTNNFLYTNSLGVYAIVPGNTISEIFNATSYGPFSKADVAFLLPTIQAWAQQSTNAQAQSKAAWFLTHYDQLR
jgi:hypothetical protein